MIISNYDDIPVGIVAVYDIDFDNGIFDWGRWIISKTAPIQAGIESMLLVYKFAFEILNLKKTRFEVRLGNNNVISLHAKYARKLNSDDNFQYFEFTSEDYMTNVFINVFKKKLC
jgi:hypothetical protein